MKPDRPGLAILYVAFASGKRAVGLRLATGGLGPRLELASELGDAVRMGRSVGTMRLGGWYDLYLPEGVAPKVRIGQTLIGSESVLGIFDEAAGQRPVAGAEPATTDVQPDPAETEPADAAEIEEEVDLEDDALLDELAGKADTDAEEEAEVVEEGDDVAEMFARLRKEARRAQDDEG